MKSLLLLLASLLWTACYFDPFAETTYSFIQKSEPYQDESGLRADIELGTGTLEIQAGGGSYLYQLDLHYDAEAFDPSVEFTREGQLSDLRLSLSGKARTARKMGRTRMNVRLHPGLWIDLSARTGVGKSSLDLSGLRIQSLRLESGVGETYLSMLSPNPIPCDVLELRSGVGALEVTGLGNFGFRHFTFKGGVGSSRLDFSGEWQNPGEIEIQVGVGGVELRIPRHLGAEIRAPENLLFSLHLEGFQKREGLYVSHNLDRADRILQLRIQTGIGGVKVRWI